MFDIGLLTRRLTDVTVWLRTQPATAGLPVGYLGASTGAAAALWAAAEPGGIAAVVVPRRTPRPREAQPSCAAKTSWPWFAATPTQPQSATGSSSCARQGLGGGLFPGIW